MHAWLMVDAGSLESVPEFERMRPKASGKRIATNLSCLAPATAITVSTYLDLIPFAHTCLDNSQKWANHPLVLHA